MISLLVVNYRSAALAASAVASARATTRRELHVIIVDNSGDTGEGEILRSFADLLIEPGRNLGYAGAINAGRVHSRGEIMVVTNPDVIFFDGALDRLCDALADNRTAVAGPALYWDEAQQWILPPGDQDTLVGKADEILASRAAGWARWRHRRRFRQRLAFWAAREPIAVPAISGAVMAIRLRHFDGVGGFDERFELYFEETDFLRRIRRAGGSVVYVPGARCRHIYNQSAGADSDRAAALYERSQRAYFAKWYGPVASSLATRLGRPPAVPAYDPCGERLQIPDCDVIVEASPLPSFATAAGHYPRSTTVSLPPEVLRAYRGDALYLRAVDPATAEVVMSCVVSVSRT